MDRKHWTRNEVVHLLKKYEKHHELWNAKCEDFKSRFRKRRALYSLAKTFKCTPGEINRKMHNLRTQFNQEYKKFEKTNQRSKWEYYDYLAFIKSPFYEPPAECDEMGEPLEKISNDTELDFEYGVDNLEMRYRVEDEHQLFGDYVASELRSLSSDYYRRQLKRNIQRCILDILDKDDRDEEVVVVGNEEMFMLDHHNDDNIVYEVVGADEFCNNNDSTMVETESENNHINIFKTEPSDNNEINSIQDEYIEILNVDINYEN